MYWKAFDWVSRSADDTENIHDYLFTLLKGFSTMCEYWVGKVDSGLGILLHEEAYQSYTFTKIFQKQSIFRLWCLQNTSSRQSVLYLFPNIIVSLFVLVSFFLPFVIDVLSDSEPGQKCQFKVKQILSWKDSTEKIRTLMRQHKLH